MSGLILPNAAAPAPSAGKVSHNRLGDDLAGWIVTALEACAPTERVTFDLSFGLVQTPEGVGPGYTVLFQMPSGVLGQNIHTVLLVTIDSINPGETNNIVRNAVEALRQIRSQIVNGGQPGVPS